MKAKTLLMILSGALLTFGQMSLAAAADVPLLCYVQKADYNKKVSDDDRYVVLKKYQLNPADHKIVSDQIPSENLSFTFSVGYVNNGDGKPVWTENDVVLQSSLTVDGYEIECLGDTYRPGPSRFACDLSNKKTKITYSVNCVK